MANFGHGGNAKEISRITGLKYEDLIDFSANINPLGMPESVKRAVINNLDAVEKYPDITYFELKNSIRDFENSKICEDELKINSKEIILGNGAAEVLFNIVKAVNPNNVLIPAPTFSEYEEAVTAVNGKINLYYLKEENQFMIQEDILDFINEKLDLVFICNPNNPTGGITNKILLKKILNKSIENNVFVIIDESFLDFVREDYSMITFIKNYQNLIIIKSLTKFFAIPGMRAGYGISSNKELLEKIRGITPAWNINILAEEAVKAALKDFKYISESINFMEKEKNYLYNELKEIDGIKVFKPSVNFIFFKLNLRKNLFDIDIKDKLLEKNILIRSCSNYHGLDNFYYRIAVKSHKDNIILVNSLKDVL
ncbi:MAG: threonine-phosphate decarboxylase [Clostridium butyricum]|nr:threonine-phosphate decarboxylase [Clostridium butyricum]